MPCLLKIVYSKDQDGGNLAACGAKVWSLWLSLPVGQSAICPKHTGWKPTAGCSSALHWVVFLKSGKGERSFLLLLLLLFLHHTTHQILYIIYAICERGQCDDYIFAIQYIYIFHCSSWRLFTWWESAIQHTSSTRDGFSSQPSTGIGQKSRGTPSERPLPEGMFVLEGTCAVTLLVCTVQHSDQAFVC